MSQAKAIAKSPAASQVKVKNTLSKFKDDNPLLSIDETNEHSIAVQALVDSFFMGTVNIRCDDFPVLLASARPVDKIAARGLINKFKAGGLSTEEAPLAMIAYPTAVDEIKLAIAQPIEGNIRPTVEGGTVSSWS